VCGQDKKPITILPNSDAPFFARWMQLVNMAVRQRGGSPDAASHIHTYVLEHPAFEEPVYKDYFIPTAPFMSRRDPDYAHMRPIAELFREDIYASSSCRLIACRRVLMPVAGVPQVRTAPAARERPPGGARRQPRAGRTQGAPRSAHGDVHPRRDRVRAQDLAPRCLFPGAVAPARGHSSLPAHVLVCPPVLPHFAASWFWFFTLFVLLSVSPLSGLLAPCISSSLSIPVSARPHYLSYLTPHRTLHTILIALLIRLPSIAGPVETIAGTNSHANAPHARLKITVISTRGMIARRPTCVVVRRTTAGYEIIIIRCAMRAPIIIVLQRRGRLHEEAPRPREAWLQSFAARLSAVPSLRWPIITALCWSTVRCGMSAGPEARRDRTQYGSSSYCVRAFCGRRCGGRPIWLSQDCESTGL
jgi:hypothetical protein